MHYPFMHAGQIPSDEKTLQYVTDVTDSDSKHNRVVGYAGNCDCSGGISCSAGISSYTLGRSWARRACAWSPGQRKRSFATPARLGGVGGLDGAGRAVGYRGRL
jgi:hypothetical protein